MKRLSSVLALLAGLILACAPAVAQEAAQTQPAKKVRAETAKPPRALGGEYAIMAAELNFSEQQTAQMAEKVKARNERLAAWLKENGPKEKQLVADRKEAKDDEARKKIDQDIAALRAERQKLLVELSAEIMNVLTAEQKVQWEGFTLYRSVMRSVAFTKPTEEQKAKIKNLAEEAAKAISQLPPDDEKARTRARGEWYGTVYKDVLTPEQRVQFQVGEFGRR